jgi:hypothetical protein
MVSILSPVRTSHAMPATAGGETKTERWLDGVRQRGAGEQAIEDQRSDAEPEEHADTERALRGSMPAAGAEPNAGDESACDCRQEIAEVECRGQKIAHEPMGQQLR